MFLASSGQVGVLLDILQWSAPHDRELPGPQHQPCKDEKPCGGLYSERYYFSGSRRGRDGVIFMQGRLLARCLA